MDGQIRGLLVVSADVDFMIRGLQKIELFGQELWITTTHVSLLLVMLFLLVAAIWIRRTLRFENQTIGGLQNIVEWAVELLDQMVADGMGQKAKLFRNYIGTVFLFLIVSNVSGLFGLRPPTADFGVTLGLGLITFVMIQYNNIKYNGRRAFTDLFQPLPFLFPINLIGEFSTPLSLSLRLFGNVLSGTVMMALIYGLLPWFVKLGLPAFLHIYFDLFSGCIQAYVFCMLTMVFVGQKIPEK